MSGGAGGGGSSAGECWISKAFAAGCKTEHYSGIPGSKTAFSHITLMALESIFSAFELSFTLDDVHRVLSSL